MTTEPHPLYNSQSWAIPVLLASCRDFVSNDNALIRFGILLWNWQPEGVEQHDAHVWEFDYYNYEGEC